MVESNPPKNFGNSMTTQEVLEDSKGFYNSTHEKKPQTKKTSYFPLYWLFNRDPCRFMK